MDNDEFINYLHNDNTEDFVYSVQNTDRLKLWSPSLKFDRDFDADRNYLKYNCDNTIYCTESQFNLTHSSEPNLTKFSVLHINARSLFKNFDNILLFIKQYFFPAVYGNS